MIRERYNKGLTSEVIEVLNTNDLKDIISYFSQDDDPLILSQKADILDRAKFVVGTRIPYSIEQYLKTKNVDDK